MRLHKIVFASTFGRGAKHLFYTACLRTSLLGIGAYSLGLALAYMLPPLPLQSGHSLSFICSGIFIIQIVVLIALFASYGIVRPGQKDTLARLLLCWPVARRSAWLALLIPGAVLALLAIGFVAPSLYLLLQQLSVGWWQSTASVILGGISALGVIYGIPRRLGYIQGIVALALVCTEYRLLRLLYQESLVSHVIGLLGWSLVICLSIALLAKSAFWLSIEASRPTEHRRVRLQFLPASYWFVKKVWRGHITKVGCIATGAMSVVLGILFWQMPFVDIALAGSTASLLAAAFVSDIRSLVRRHRAIEITGIRGLVYFMRKQLGAATVLSTIATGPFLVTVLYRSWPLSLGEIGRDLALPLLLGIASGIFASTLTAPGPRDITAQSTATLLATGILVAPQLSIFSQLTDLMVITIKIALTAVLLTTAVFIEYKRNPFIWRKLYDAR